jgi:flagellar protein FliL
MAEQAAESIPVEQDNDTTAESTDKKNPKRIIFVLMLMPIIAALAFLLIVKVVNPRLSPSTDTVPIVEEVETESAIWELGTKLANPMGTKNARVMKVAVSLEVASEGLVEGIEKQRKKLEDRFLTILTSKTLSEISSPDGKTKLKNELKKAFTSDLGLKEGDIRRVYFGEFVIQ